MAFYTLSEAARSISVTVQAFKKRKEICDLVAAAEDGRVKTGLVKVRGRPFVGYPLEAFPVEVRIALGDESLEGSQALGEKLEGNKERQELCDELDGFCGDKRFGDIFDSPQGEASTDRVGADGVAEANETASSTDGEAAARDINVAVAGKLGEPAGGVEERTAGSLSSNEPAPKPRTRTTRSRGRLTREDKREAKLLMLDVFAVFVEQCKASGNTAMQCWEEFRLAYDRGELEVPELVARAYPKSPAPSTLKSWEKTAKANPLQLVDGRGGARRYGHGRIHEDPELESAIQGAIRYLGVNATARQILKLPQIKPFKLAIGTVQRYLTYLQTEDRALWLKLQNPRAYKNSLAVKFGSRSRGLEPNDLWELDFTRNDLILDFNGEKKRYSYGGVIDVATRRVIFLLSSAPRGEASVELLIRALESWGVPRVVRPDNGKEFINQRLRAFAKAVDFVLDPPPPGTPEGKPHIERIFRTVNHDLIPLLPSHVGASVCERVAKREAQGELSLLDLAMPWTQFQDWLDQWATDYEQRTHSGLECSPTHKYSQFLQQGFATRKLTATVDQLRILALPRALKRVSANGIRHNGRRYVATELGEVVGQKVWVLEDNDPRKLYVLDNEQESVICTAQWEVSISDEELARIAKAAKAGAQRIREAGAAAGRAARKSAKEIAADPLKLLDGKSATVARIGEAVEEMEVSLAHQLGVADGSVVELGSKREDRTIADYDIPTDFKPAADLLGDWDDLKTPEEKDAARLETLIARRPIKQWTVDDWEFLKSKSGTVLELMELLDNMVPQEKRELIEKRLAC
ncbi:MAG: DDE-type integrase/transposase/recombinase [Cyanobacteria bacterium J06638_20]